jgi:CRISPR-associated protein Cas6
MYWKEETSEEQFVIPDEVVDLMFQIRCPTLPMDHAWMLSRAITEVLPWFPAEPRAGMHIIHGADSGNGWERPSENDALLHLSRRTRLILRLPKPRLEAARALTGRTLHVDGHRMTVEEAKERPLSKTNILYSRYVAADPAWDEDTFMAWAVDGLQSMGLEFKKILSGKSSRLNGENGPLATRSLMVANMPFEDAIKLQIEGLGSLRSMGCGLFIPQKSF